MGREGVKKKKKKKVKTNYETALGENRSPGLAVITLLLLNTKLLAQSSHKTGRRKVKEIYIFFKYPEGPKQPFNLSTNKFKQDCKYCFP